MSDELIILGFVWFTVLFMLLARDIRKGQREVALELGRIAGAFVAVNESEVPRQGSDQLRDHGDQHDVAQFDPLVDVLFGEKIAVHSQVGEHSRDCPCAGTVADDMNIFRICIPGQVFK